MKPEPAPKVEGTTPWKRLNSAVRQIFTVSKEDVLEGRSEAETRTYQETNPLQSRRLS
jgi:hypothetical protein